MAVISSDSQAAAAPPRPLLDHLASAATALVELVDSSDSAQLNRTSMAKHAKTIADNLTSEELRTVVGETGVVSAIGRLFERVAQLGSVEDGGVVAARTELCRAVGNLCFDHDANRQRTLDAKIPSLIALMIESTTAEREGQDGRRKLGMLELKLLRAAVGALLNSSLKFDPIRRELTKSTVLASLLSLIDNRPDSRTALPVYVVGQWASESTATDGDAEERVELGETIARWTVSVLEDVLGEDNSHFPTDGIAILASVIFSLDSKQIPQARPAGMELDDSTDFVDTDIELLSISAALLEGLSLDHASVKSTIALSTYDSTSPSPSSRTLSRLLDFIESSTVPSLWTSGTDELERVTKAHSTVKAAVVRAVVECPNDDSVMEALWSESKGDQKGNWLVERLVGWLEREGDEGWREDLVVCAAHFLAGLGRRDEYTEALVQDYGLAAPLARIIERRTRLALRPPPIKHEPGAVPPSATPASRPGETTQILYGVVSLMRHLAIPLKNRSVVAETGIVSVVAQLLRRELDIVQPLQMSVVGLLKHLTALNLSTSLEILSSRPGVPDAEADADSTSELPLSLILGLIARTDEIRLRSESTRILVNLVRSLFSSPRPPTTLTQPSIDSDEITDLRRKGQEILLAKKEVVEALSEQVRLSEKYPILVNEGIVALTLLAGNGELGASAVLSALVATRRSPDDASESASDDPTESSAPPRKRAASLAISPGGDPPRSIDMVVNWISTLVAPPSLIPADVPSDAPQVVRPEMIANACTLVMTVLQNVQDRSSPGKDEVRSAVIGPLKGVVETLDAKAGSTGGLRDGIANVVRRTLEIVESS
ncbi:hypothetical protein JCM10212_001051 [Sporobolomyces blumeae]